MKIPTIIMEDWPRKLAALTFALLVWYSVHRQIREVETISGLPVEFKKSENVEILDAERVPSIRLKVRGSKRTIRELAADDIKIIHQIPEGVTVGTYAVELKAKNIKLPHGVQLVGNVDPSAFSITLDRVIQKDRVPIRVMFSGQPPSNMVRKSVQIMPRTATVIGPDKFVKDINEVVTNAVELGQNTPPEFQLDLPLLNIPHVKVVPERVRVSVEFTKVKGTKNFENLEIFVMNSRSSNLYVEEFVEPAQPQVSALLEGPRDTVDFLTAASVRAFIDISDIAGPVSSAKKKVYLWVNAGDCAAVWIQPAVVMVKVSRHPPAASGTKGD